MVQRSILAMRFGCRTLADKSGKKQAGIEFVESLFLKHPIASSKIVTDKVASPRKSLNSDHEVWCNPWNQQMASTASFPDLFNQALTKCGVIYTLIEELISSGKFASPAVYEFLLDELGNYSYHSGLPVDD